jgi:hypothetical protein
VLAGELETVMAPVWYCDAESTRSVAPVVLIAPVVPPLDPVDATTPEMNLGPPPFIPKNID